MLSVLLTLVLFSLPLALTQVSDPVAFTAIKGSVNGNYIAFQAVIVNNNADLTPAYGAFKCKKPGIYFFTFTAVSVEGSDIRISLRSNGVPVVTIYSGGSSSFNSASGSGLMQLEENDLVYLYIEKGEIYESNKINRAFTTFSGFQISAAKSGGMFSGILGRNGYSPLTLFNDKDEDDLLTSILSSNTTIVADAKSSARFRHVV